MLMLVLTENVEVLIAVGLLMMKPEGVSVIVAVALVNPGAVAVTVTGPALASACMKNPGLLVEPCGIVITSWPVPAAVPLADSTSLLASLLVSVICCPPVGAGAPPEPECAALVHGTAIVRPPVRRG